MLPLEAFWVFFRHDYLQGDILPITHEKTAIANCIKGSESSQTLIQAPKGSPEVWSSILGQWIESRLLHKRVNKRPHKCPLNFMLFDMENSFTLSHHTPPTDHRSITKPWEWFFCVPGSSARLLACFGRVCVCSDGLCYYLSCVQDVHCVHEWFVLLPIMYLKKTVKQNKDAKQTFLHSHVLSYYQLEMLDWSCIETKHADGHIILLNL